jgi:CheY-like chemotaxis protein
MGDSIMNPIIYFQKDELEGFRRIVAMLFLVVGTAIVAAALIVQIGAASFQFAFVGISLLPLLLLLTWLFLRPYLNIWLPDRLSFLKTGHPVNSHDRHVDERPVVLIADKDIFMRSALDFHLTRSGFRVEHAANKDEAIAKMAEHPSVVLFDLSLSRENRFYGLRDIRKASPDAKVIALMRKRTSRDRSTFRRLGAYDSLLKPLDPDDVVRTIESALSVKPVVEVRLSA